MDPVLESYHALEEKIKQYNHNLDTKRLYAAFQYADSCLLYTSVVTRFDAPLTPGQRVELLPKTSAGAAELPFPILYEDDGLLVVDKPAGLLSMGNEKERRRTAYRRCPGPAGGR